LGRKLIHNFKSFRVSLQLIMYVYCIDVWPMCEFLWDEIGELRNKMLMMKVPLHYSGTKCNATVIFVILEH